MFILDLVCDHNVNISNCLFRVDNARRKKNCRMSPIVTSVQTTQVTYSSPLWRELDVLAVHKRTASAT